MRVSAVLLLCLVASLALVSVVAQSAEKCEEECYKGQDECNAKCVPKYTCGHRCRAIFNQCIKGCSFPHRDAAPVEEVAAAAEKLMNCGPCPSLGSTCRLVPECKARGCCRLSVQEEAAKPELKQLSESNYQSQFVSFVKEQDKKYTHDEFFQRYNIFKANLNLIREHNAAQKSYTLGVNQFADLTQAEFEARFLTYQEKDNDYYASINTEGPHSLLKESDLASSLDWRTKGAVTPMKDQGGCGSCWAFSATGSMEGAHFLAKGKLENLSEQQLVDCSRPQGNQGCRGGLMTQAFQYVISNKGITSTSQYPYHAKDETCKTNVTPVATISSFVNVQKRNEDELIKAVNIVPVSIAVEAGQPAFRFYRSGVLDDASCGTRLNHGITLVGYDTDAASGKDYYIVRNSWGTGWGDGGYAKLVRGKNQCGISQDPSYAVV